MSWYNFYWFTEHHAWLLSESVDLLPKILLPLAGPEEFSDEEYEKLPIELQYLGDEKTREVDPDVRLILLEALIQVALYSQLFLREFCLRENDKVYSLKCFTVVHDKVWKRVPAFKKHLRDITRTAQVGKG